ncbi:MAG TPA: heme-binding protein [Oligoflexus sp.]|uniref:heme-binding protein n=1 Tax=Oligoflexus sp. TaxID=1971216 RepID=UPI002D7F10C1|nr:heme-binding protein [Oligoflexus sp.]HET9240673.1 heme-binding protein [Oligoflexus sp.]
MRMIFLLLALLSTKSFGQDKKDFVSQETQLNLEGAKEVASRVEAASKKLGKKVSLAVVGVNGETLLIYKGDQVGPHNTEAARRKAYTALSTKTATLELMRKATANPDTRNLAELPELLLLSGGVPLWKNGVVIGAIGVAGGGSPENDHALAQSGALSELGITTK